MSQYKPSPRARIMFIAAATVASSLAAPASPASAESGDLTDVRAAGETISGELLAACPINGPATYEDSWGWARSGGRSHQGVDMMADRGTPVVAVADGDAMFKQNRLGGNAVWLTAANGDTFYYAHLDGFAGESRVVQTGDVIGFVGSTGNAGGPHLHFETLPGGRVENPYLHTVAACVPTPEELAAIEAHQANALNDPSLGERFVPTA